MADFQRKYTDEQRDACAEAFEDRRVRPASRVVGLAARGELEHNGARLPAFDVGEDTVRDLARKLRKERLGQKSSKLDKAEPRDANEALRRRIVAALDAKLDRMERRLKKDESSVSFVELGQAARAQKEAAAMAGRDDPRPNRPGAKVNGERETGATQGGLGGSLLTAHRQQGKTAQQPTTHNNGSTEKDAAQPSDEAQEQEGAEDDAPGLLARSVAMAQLAG